jgi:glucan phosphorylase
MNTPPATSACFSMRIALEPAMPAYSGGPGVLAGDTIRSVVDLKVPRVAVTLLHRKEQRPPGKCGALETKKWGAW